jgi:hypothetical protein
LRCSSVAFVSSVCQYLSCSLAAGNAFSTMWRSPFAPALFACGLENHGCEIVDHVGQNAQADCDGPLVHLRSTALWKRRYPM